MWHMPVKFTYLLTYLNNFYKGRELIFSSYLYFYKKEHRNYKVEMWILVTFLRSYSLR